VVRADVPVAAVLTDIDPIRKRKMAADSTVLFTTIKVEPFSPV